jgi:hypothetical protein
VNTQSGVIRIAVASVVVVAVGLATFALDMNIREGIHMSSKRMTVRRLMLLVRTTVVVLLLLPLLAGGVVSLLEQPGVVSVFLSPRTAFTPAQGVWQVRLRALAVFALAFSCS